MPRASTRKAKPGAAPAAPVIKWTASEIVSRKIAELRPHPKNPNTHPQEQIDNLVALFRAVGFHTPILVDENDTILAGHGRRLAALQAGMVEVPTIKRTGLTEAEKLAILISDNQNPRLSVIDEELLKGNVVELKRLDFDLNLLGFPDLKLVEFVSGLGDGVTPPPEAAADGADRELTDEETKALDDAWRTLVKEWNHLVNDHPANGFLSTSYTKGALAVYFMRARLYGSTIPSAATLAYTPHRMLIKGDKDSLDSALRQRTDSILAGLRFICQGQPKFDKLLGMTLAVQGCRLPGEFPADLARDLYDEFVTEPNGVVLDPCHGWGGRMLGFLLSKHAAQYDGYDVDPKTHRGVRELFSDLRGLAASKKGAATYCEPFETAKLKPNRYDFALTSPPYFNVEKYGGDQSSWKLYSDYDKWVAGFYAPMIQSVAKALKPGASFALQVGNQSYPLEESAKTIADGCGLWYVETRHTGMINNYNKTEKEDGEVIVIFRKGTPENPALADAATKFGKVMK